MPLSPSTKSAVEALPAEATTVRKVWKALKDAGNPVVSVWDGEESIPVSNRDEVLEAVFAVDQAWLYTESGAFVLIILGNEWDALSDYNVSLEDALKPVNDYLQSKW
jgi:hypothetical protein